MAYLIEATLYNGQHMQSKDLDAVEPESRHSFVYDLRCAAMIEAVAVIDLATGEVVADLPSFGCLARCRGSRLENGDPIVPVITYRAA